MSGATQPETTRIPVVEAADSAPAPGRPAVPGSPAPAGTASRPRVPVRWSAVHGAGESARTWLVGPEEADDRDERPARPAVVAAVVVFFGVVIHQLLTRPATFLGGQMWAEMGTNYFPTAGSGSLVTQLLATDSGYIPLPQRIIASLGAGFGLAPSVIPYYYNGTALLLTALMVASVCLPVFRAVLSSDLLRTALAVALALLPDFESRTFINFTYFGLVPLALVTALAVTDRRREVPAWAWLLPLLMISKPAVLAVLPAIVVAAVVAGRRFRRIAVACAAAAAVQVVQLAISANSGSSLLQSNDVGLPSMLLAAAKYTVAMLGRFATGSLLSGGPRAYLAAGAVVLVVLVVMCWFLKGRASVVVVLGLSLLSLTMLVNCLTFGDVFTRDIALVVNPGLDRRFFGAVVGGLLIAAGTIALLVQELVRRSVASRRGSLLRSAAGPLAVVLFAGWFGLAGWADYTRLINSPLQFPLVGSSQWEAQAAAVNGADPAVCVPLDPFGWFYGRGCTLLVLQPSLPPDFAYESAVLPSGDSRITASVPDAVQDDQLESIGVLVRPLTTDGQVTAVATASLADGSEIELNGSRQVPASGGLIQLEAVTGSRIVDAVSVEITFDIPVEVGTGSTPSGTEPVVLWMGQPAP